MNARIQRYTCLQIAVLGFEAVWIALLVVAIGSPVSASVIWGRLFGVGLGLLGWNRWLLKHGRWQTLRGGLSGILVMVGLFGGLLYLTAPEAMRGLLAAQNGREGIRLFFASPLLVITSVAVFLLLFRVLRLLYVSLTMWLTRRRFLVSTLLVMLMLLLAWGRGQAVSGSILLIYFVCGLLALALGRTHELGRLPQGGSLPFNRRWLANVGGGIFGVLLLSGGVMLFLSLREHPLLLSLVNRVLEGGIWLLGVFLEWIFSWLIPAMQGVVDTYAVVLEESIIPVLKPFLEMEGSAEMQPLTAFQVRLLAIMLVLATIGFPLLVLYQLYRLQQVWLAQGEEEENESEAVSPEGGFQEWLLEQGASLRRFLSRSFPAHFGVETVRDLYKNLLLFGEAHQIARPAQDTPYEYLEPLSHYYPQRRPDFLLLTDAYVAAHYGERHFSRADIERLQAAWGRIANTRRAILKHAKEANDPF